MPEVHLEHQNFIKGHFENDVTASCVKNLCFPKFSLRQTKILCKNWIFVDAINYCWMSYKSHPSRTAGRKTKYL